MQRSLAGRLWYRAVQIVCRLAGVLAWGVRCYGESHVPASGGVLVLSNHQSHLDPVLIGLACRRRLNFVARETLFRFAGFAWLIHSLDAIPIDREGMGLGGLKETLTRLKKGEMVLLFPEGTRTPDGDVHPMKPGFCALARRGGAALVPAAIDGAFAVWPKSRRFPGRGQITIIFGQPLLSDQVVEMNERDLIEAIQQRVEECHRQARRQRQRLVGE